MKVEINIFDSTASSRGQPSLIFEDTKTGDIRIVISKWTGNGYNKIVLGIISKNEIKRLARSC